MNHVTEPTRFEGTELAAEYREARRRMSEIARTLSVADASANVAACPAWSVKDLLSHVTGIAVDLGSGNSPKGDTQAWVDRQVAERSTRDVVTIVDEWNAAAPQFESMIEGAPAALWGLTYDLVVHEHDLRTAVGRPGERASHGVRVAAELGLRLVKGDLAKAGLPAFRAVIDGTEFVVGAGEPELELRASAFECLRLLGSRRTVDELRAADFSGDLDRYLSGLLHMDLPVRSLGE